MEHFILVIRHLPCLWKAGLIFFFLFHCVFSVCKAANNTSENAAKMTSKIYLFYLKGSTLKSVLIHFHLLTYRTCITLYRLEKY